MTASRRPYLARPVSAAPAPAPAPARRRLLQGLGVLAISAFGMRFARAGAFEDYFHAVKLNDVETVRKLLARGFDPNAVEAERGDTGLILALREKAMKVFALLMQQPNIDVEVRARNGDTALMIAAYTANVAALTALLDKAAEPNRPGWTALHYAAAVGSNECVQILLDHHAYIDAESPNKTTPIMMAARGGYIYTVKLLLDEGADATLKNGAGFSAIDFARAGGFNDIVEGLTYRLKKAGKM